MVTIEYIGNLAIYFFYSEYLLRINTEAQFTFPMVRIKLIPDSSLHVGSHIQGYNY